MHIEIHFKCNNIFNSKSLLWYKVLKSSRVMEIYFQLFIKMNNEDQRFNKRRMKNILIGQKEILNYKCRNKLKNQQIMET